MFLHSHISLLHTHLSFIQLHLPYLSDHSGMSLYISLTLLLTSLTLLSPHSATSPFQYTHTHTPQSFHIFPTPSYISYTSLHITHHSAKASGQIWITSSGSYNIYWVNNNKQNYTNHTVSFRLGKSFWQTRQWIKKACSKPGVGGAHL